MSCNTLENKRLVKELMLKHKEIANKKDYIKQYKELIFKELQLKPCNNFIRTNTIAIKNNTLTLESNEKERNYEYNYNGVINKRKYKSTCPNSCALKENREKVMKYLIENPGKRKLTRTELISDIKKSLDIEVSLSGLRTYLMKIDKQ